MIAMAIKRLMVMISVSFSGLMNGGGGALSA
jgi:hypothetical protein